MTPRLDIHPSPPAPVSALTQRDWLSPKSTKLRRISLAPVKFIKPKLCAKL